MSTESVTNSPDKLAKKPAAGLGFLTILMFLLAGALIATPFFWGLKDRAEVTPDPSVLNEWTQWAGDIHVMVLHIPIGIFVYVFGMEILGLLSFRKFKPNLSGALFFTVVSTVIAMATGYLNFLQGSYGRAPFDDFDHSMGMHMWGILLFAIFVIFSFVSKMWSRHNEKGSVFYPVFMLISAAALGFSAHHGGALVHGEDEAAAMINDPLVLLGCKEAEVVEVTDHQLDYSEIAPEDRMAFEQVIKPILVSKCWACHAKKGDNPAYPLKGNVKSKLLMTTVEELVAGGKGMPDFPTLVPSDPDNSEMIVRVELDKDDDEFMPKGKEDEPEFHFTEGEIRVMRWWIKELKGDDLSDRPVKEISGYQDLVSDIAAIQLVLPDVRNEDEEEEYKEGNPKVGSEDDILNQQAKILEALPNTRLLLVPGTEELSFESAGMGKALTDEKLALLEPVAASITQLNLSHSGVSDAGMKSVAKMAKLRALALNETSISNAGLKELAQLPALSSISLTGASAVDDKGLKVLSSMVGLRRIFLMGTKATSEGITHLQNALPEAGIRYDTALTPELKTEGGRFTKKTQEEPKAKNEIPAKEPISVESPKPDAVDEVIEETSSDEPVAEEAIGKGTEEETESVVPVSPQTEIAPEKTEEGGSDSAPEEKEEPSPEKVTPVEATEESQEEVQEVEQTEPVEESAEERARQVLEELKRVTEGN